MLEQSLSTDVAVGLSRVHARGGPAVVQSGDWATTDAPIACIGNMGCEREGLHSRCTHARTQRSTVGTSITQQTDTHMMDMDSSHSSIDICVLL